MDALSAFGDKGNPIGQKYTWCQKAINAAEKMSEAA
jgi:hypothetical protein